MFWYDLRIGLPHTNYNYLAEHHLLAHAGHFQWSSIAQTIDSPLSALRTLDGGEVYATFFYIEERFPEDRIINTFKLDTDLNFLNTVTAFKNIMVEGQILFDSKVKFNRETYRGQDIFSNDDILYNHPYFRFANIFISPVGGNTKLKISPPANANFSNFKKATSKENPYNFLRKAEKDQVFDLLNSPDWEDITASKDLEYRYKLWPERDTNGAGLVYFSNYVVFMNQFDSEVMTNNSTRSFSPFEIKYRTLQHRKIGYFGNIDINAEILVSIRLFRNLKNEKKFGFRYFIKRANDGETVCISEAVKIVSCTNEFVIIPK